ncbi:TIGR02530 family flagellar biosynthesis protein [Syntrophotalea acetylenica]|uniref:TIGR02530 family flagellar biosynthesis protein n=1 Tax=Syntrophotalea acetylenica TaxID=29542 RepID=UPI002A35CB0C|nr:TIGR02530 family flagellar biosynthesis protein [Syntrophotalea acetylenica]MDY0262857.1 TIGR02530 family flagellar biosynthesis protein [Syntrophotalea acetylenica]
MGEQLTIIPQPAWPLSTPDRTARPATGSPGKAFEQALSRQMANPVGFSRHALDRLASRDITFSDQDVQRLGEAVDQLQAKGGRDALVLMDTTALVVSVKNRQVVTVMDQSQLKNNVFTHIDSAIIA